MRTRFWLTSLITISVAAPAQAGTIKRVTYPGAGKSGPSSYYVFTAAPGERNDIVVERVPGGLRLADSGATPTGCPADGPNSVICPGADDDIAVVRTRTPSTAAAARTPSATPRSGTASGSTSARTAASTATR